MVVAGLAFALLINIAYRVLDTPFWNYNGSRLMPSFAVARGWNYYVLPHGGPLFCTIYGPMTAIIYLPATLLATPNGAVIAGSLISAILCFTAVAFLHFTRSRHGRQDRAAFLAAGLLVCYLEPLRYACFNIHADGPGLAFSAFACSALYMLDARRWALPFSAFFAVFAICCKQTFLPLPIALLAYVAFAAGIRQALRYAAWLCAAGLLLGGIVVLAAGPARLYHCLIWVPMHQPWSSASALVSWMQAIRNFIRLSLPVLIPLLAAGGYLLATARLDLRSLRSLATHRSVPLLMTGVTLLPASILGRAKVGGDINSFSFALFFLTCGLTVLLADSVATAGLPTLRRLAAWGLVAIILPIMVSEAPLVIEIPSKIRQLPQSGQNVAYEYLVRHPGQAYFPWFPLSHFYAEHQFRHYGYGIGDRLLAGESFTTADFRAYMPPQPALIAFSKDGTREVAGYDLLKYLPEYRRKIDDPELTGWTAYAKDAGP